MTYPFTSLPENLAAFCAVLRRDHRFHVGPRELVDAAHALEIVDIANERAVRDALRPVLSKTYDDVSTFDTAFDRFFHGDRDRSAPGDTAGGLDEIAKEGDEAGIAGVETRASTHDSVNVAVADSAVGADAVRDVANSEEEDEVGVVLRASYSPLEGEGSPLVLEPPSPAWLQAAATLARRLPTGASRRWRPAVRGPRFDFRRTLRTSLHTGGEPVTPRWHAHPRRRPRFVLLIDGSRSMGASAGPALHTAVALSAVSPNTETFTFSTMLRRMTRDVRRAAAGEQRTLDVQQAWGGGTTIGACLDDFLLHFSERLLGRDTVVMVASDGLDVGNPELLRQSMARLGRRSAAVVWINPLLETAGYEPTAVGMRLARPYVTVLTSVRDPQGLRSLARSLPVR